MNVELIPTSRLAKSFRLNATRCIELLEEQGEKPVSEWPTSQGKKWRMWNEKTASLALARATKEMRRRNDIREEVNATHPADPLDPNALNLILSQLTGLRGMVATTIQLQQELTASVTDLMDSITAPVEAGDDGKERLG